MGRMNFSLNKKGWESAPIGIFESRRLCLLAVGRWKSKLQYVVCKRKRSRIYTGKSYVSLWSLMFYSGFLTGVNEFALFRANSLKK